MLRHVSVTATVLLLLCSCDGEKGTSVEPVHDWQLRLDEPSQDHVAEIGAAISSDFYDFYTGAAALYSSYGDWSHLYVHGWVPKEKKSVERFVRRHLGDDVTLIFGSEGFPSPFSEYAACRPDHCAIEERCNRTFKATVDDPMPLTRGLLEFAMARGYPITGVVFQGREEAFDIKVPFYADCDAADAMVADMRAAVE